MAAVIGTPYSPPSPPDTSSSATMSPVYPDRPIRPLPKRSLRERLSPEVAEQIPYPSTSASTELMFNLQYNAAKAQRDHQGAMQEVDRALINAQEGYEESYDSLSMISRYRDLNEKGIAVPAHPRGASRTPQPIAHSIASSTDSVDGYDSFENTNNKKKRKIPIPGGPGSYNSNLSTSLSNDLANMGISGSRDASLVDEFPSDSAGPYYGTGASTVPSGTGISGAGRGRYGRNGRRDVNGRSPLGVTAGNGAGNWQAARANHARRDMVPAGSSGGRSPPPDHGIISAAIAEAATSPSTPPRGQENISLLDQQARGSAPAKTQFTFTCESDTTKAMSWPPDHEPLPYDSYQHTGTISGHHNAANQKGFSTQGTQTSPVMTSQGGQNGAPAGGPSNPPPPRKPRRSPAKRYAMAAEERRHQQADHNYHHPPKEEDIWICEFCEYESIFGTPPEALVRQYEIKDRRERKKLAEKRRLLEKAKMKGRKNKKATKNAAKHNAAAAAHQYGDKSLPPQHGHDPTQLHSHDVHSDEYYADDYEEDPSIPLPFPPEVPTKIPQPVAQHGLHPRFAHADGLHTEHRL